MGAEDLPDTLIGSTEDSGWKRRWPRGLGSLLAWLPVLFAPVLLTPGLGAQGALSRDFEQAFLARRETEIDQAFAEARKQLQLDALLPLQRAIDLRSTPVLNGERSKLLAEALAVLQGLDYEKDAKGELVFKDKQSYADFCWRFNFWLLALPEVVDPLKSRLDEDRVLSIFRGSMPKLQAVVGPLRRLEDNQIHITARGVFGLPKPEVLSLRMGIRQLRGQVLASATREDSDDPGGWRVFDLEKAFPVEGYGAGYYEAFTEIVLDGRKRRDFDPRLRTSFAIRPGFYRDLWTLFSWRKRLSDRMDKSDAAHKNVRPMDLSRLDALTMELYRAFVLGKEYGFRPWTLESLDEGLALLETLLAGKKPALPEIGDRVYGVRLEDGKSLPVRISHGKPDRAGKRRATIWFAPVFWDKDWAVDGLGLSCGQFQKEGELHVFIYHQPQKGYLEGIQDLLRQEFGIGPEGLRVVGVQDGVTRARFSLPLLKKPPVEFVWIGASQMPREPLAEGIPVRLFPALGLPASADLKAFRAQVEKLEGKRGGLTVSGPSLRSLGRALRAFLEGH